jgi:polar amino acid transport system permease protein
MRYGETFVETTIPPDRPNPQKRNVLINRLKKAPWWLLLMALILIYLYFTLSENPVYVNFWNRIQSGIEITVRVSIRAYALALVIGLVLALMRLSDNFFFYQISTFYVELIRGIPTLVLVFYVALGLTPKLAEWLNALGNWLVNNDLDISGKGTYLARLRSRDINEEYRVVVALAISYSAFLSEIFRAGIQSVPIGQIEAAKSLGLNRWKTTSLIVLPQAFRTILPPLGNDFIAMLKESSLVSAVGIQDITQRGRTLQYSSFRVFEIFNVVALTYLVLTLSLAIMVKALEWHLDEKQSKPQWYINASRQGARIFSIDTYQDLFSYLIKRLKRLP